MLPEASTSSHNVNIYIEVKDHAKKEAEKFKAKFDMVKIDQDKVDSLMAELSTVPDKGSQRPYSLPRTRNGM